MQEKGDNRDDLWSLFLDFTLAAGEAGERLDWKVWTGPVFVIYSKDVSQSPVMALPRLIFKVVT